MAAWTIPTRIEMDAIMYLLGKLLYLRNNISAIFIYINVILLKVRKDLFV